MELAIKVLLVCYAAAVASLAWNWVRSVFLVGGQRGLEPLDDIGRGWPSVDVVVPVKDEQRHIARCLESIVESGYPGLRVLTVNDRSTDGTAAEIAEVRRRHPQIDSNEIRELPAGLFGKPHAIHSISSRLQGAYVAFVDSDLRLHPRCLHTLVAHMHAEGLDWLALGGTPDLCGFWERLVIPVCGAVAMAWYDPRRVRDPNWDDALGSPLMVCRREAYERIGGHGAVVREYDEDSALMRLAKRSGQRVAFELAPRLFAQRFYGGLRDTIRGMTRTFAGGIKTLPRLMHTAAALQFVSLAPLGLAAALAWAWAAEARIPWRAAWTAAAGVHLVVAFLLARLVFRTAGQARLAWLHPLGAMIATYITIRAAAHQRARKAIEWRGTTYGFHAAGGQ